MIIKAPTALYSKLLPLETASGNVTYTISNNDPPRQVQITGVIPPAIRNRELPSLVYDKPARREHIGEHLFTISKSNITAIGSNVKQFEVGQVIGFSDASPLDVDSMPVSSMLEIRHDTNLLDYDKIGLSSDVVSMIIDKSNQKLDELLALLSNYRLVRQRVDVDLTENNKLQNETNKVMNAIIAMNDSSLGVVVTELAVKLEDLKNREEELIEEANESSRMAFEVVGKIRDLTQMVR